MTQTDNVKVLREGFKKAERIIRSHLQKQMVNISKGILEMADDNREFTGFTGNTQLSYLAGLYTRGKNDMAKTQFTSIRQTRNTGSPRRGKIRKGEWGWLKDPYEGKPRSILGKVDVGQSTGFATSMAFLRTYQAKYGHIAAVITTGTEYSRYLEESAHLDVLSKTYDDARRLLLSWFEPLPNK